MLHQQWCEAQSMIAAGTRVAGPHLGAQFAQLVKELRSEYAAAVTACAERIAGALFQRPGYSINATLHRHGISGTPSIMQQQVLPFCQADMF